MRSAETSPRLKKRNSASLSDVTFIVCCVLIIYAALLPHCATIRLLIAELTEDRIIMDASLDEPLAEFMDKNSILQRVSPMYRYEFALNTGI